MSNVPPPVPWLQPEPEPQPKRRRGFLSTTRSKVIAALSAAVVVVLAVVLALVLTSSPGVPSTIHGTISSTELKALAPYGLVSNCILNLPDNGNQVTLIADGVSVGTAQLGKLRQIKDKLGEVCSIDFRFINVPAGHQRYAVKIDAVNSGFVSGGCTGTIYYTAARLATGKPLELSCS